MNKKLLATMALIAMTTTSAYCWEKNITNCHTINSKSEVVEECFNENQLETLTTKTLSTTRSVCVEKQNGKRCIEDQPNGPIISVIKCIKDGKNRSCINMSKTPNDKELAEFNSYLNKFQIEGFTK